MTDDNQVWGIFADPRAAAEVVRRWPDTEVFSAEPSETLVGVHETEKTPLGALIVLGGTLGGLGGGALAAYTGIWMGLDVGGLPRIPYAPVGIVTFAITALGAIAGALITLFVRGRIFGLRLDMPEPARRRVAEGAVATMIRVLPEERAAMAEALQQAGAEAVLQ